MAENFVALETNGIKRALRSIKPYEAIAEFIWNGFDAEATQVSLSFIKNQLNSIDAVNICDNGHGISKDSFYNKFHRAFESQKNKIAPASRKNSSIIHGRDGVGRFTFFVLANHATWTTVYSKDGKQYEYTIDISAKTLNKFDDSDEREVECPSGTTVELLNFDAKDFDELDLLDFLALEFAWYLELNKAFNFSILIDETPLDYSGLLANQEERSYIYEKANINYAVAYCRWNERLNEEYSKYYYLNSGGKEIYKENTTLNNKGDRFYHSVFIQSKIFDCFSFETTDQISLLEPEYTKTSPAFTFIKEQVDKHLREMRMPFIKKYTEKYIADLKSKDAYPSLNKDNAFDKFREEALDDMVSVIYAAEPKIFSSLNITQQKTLVRLFDLTMQSGETESLYRILEGILDMPADERSELADLLKYTSMSNITKTIILVKDRLETVQRLKTLVLDNKTETTERYHLQPFIEKNYWIFGEEYYLVTAEEPDFEEALRRYLYVLRGEENPKGSIKIDDKDKKKQMDIFAVQRKLDGNLKKCIIVELKRPSLTIGSKELTQVKNYFNVIKKEDRFNASNIEWEFFLVGNDYNNEIELELESSRNHGERSLVFRAAGMKIYVKKWSEIITDQEINLNFLQEKLLINQELLMSTTKNATIKDITSTESSADRPKEIIVP